MCGQRELDLFKQATHRKTSRSSAPSIRQKKPLKSSPHLYRFKTTLIKQSVSGASPHLNAFATAKGTNNMPTI
jgi:hypothetical protein